MAIGLNAKLIDVRLKYTDEGAHATVRRYVMYTDGTGAMRPETKIPVPPEVEAWLLSLMDAAKANDVSDKP